MNDPIEPIPTKNSKTGSNQPSKNKWPILIIGSIAAILIILFLIGLLSRLFLLSSLEEEAQMVNPLIVKVIEVKPDKNPIELMLPSITQAIRFTPIWARVNGYIKDFYVDIGDEVHENQLLAVISTPELDHQLLQAKADLSISTARLEIAQITAARWQDVYLTDKEAVSTQEVQERQSSFQVEIAAVESALQNVERLEKLKGFNKLYAPFSGTITERNIELGTLISEGSSNNLQQIYMLTQNDIIRIFVSVPQPYFRLIKVGNVTQVKVSQYPEKIFKGVIDRTAKALDPVSRTLLTQINVSNPEGLLIPGLYTEVTFTFIPDVDNYIIPSTALIIREGHPHVAVVDDHCIAHLKRVLIGRDYGRTLEIVSGLNDGDKVVINPNEKIVEGVQVVTNTSQ
jgi:membrane fusion protein, multidrug efflux system